MCEHELFAWNMLVRVLIALAAIMNMMRVVRQGATLRIPKWDEMSILLIIASIMELIRFAISGNLINFTVCLQMCINVFH